MFGIRPLRTSLGVARSTVMAIALVVAVGCGSDDSSGGAASSGAQLVSEVAIDGRMRDLAIASPALGRDVGVRILLPAGWESHPKRRWPVLYVLHGARAVPDGVTTNFQVWTEQTDIAELTANTDVLVVMPEGGNVGWYSDWYNDGAGGPPGWETFHLVELREILESHYRAGDDRAIAGLSMGGFGAASYAARNPGMFLAIASFSGALTTLNPIAQTIVTVSLRLNAFDAEALWGNPLQQSQIWQAHDPYSLAENLVSIPVFVSCGNGAPGVFDPSGTPSDGLEGYALQSAQAFVDHLNELGGNVTADLYGDGTHTWPYWERELHRAFPILMQAIGAEANGEPASASASSR